MSSSGSTASAEGRIVTLEELATHKTLASCWIAIDGGVYDVSATNWLDDHPGGPDMLMGVAGKDATRDFTSIHSRSAYKIMTRLRVGSLPEGVGVRRADLEAEEGAKEAGEGAKKLEALAAAVMPVIEMKNPPNPSDIRAMLAALLGAADKAGRGDAAADGVFIAGYASLQGYAALLLSLAPLKSRLGDDGGAAAAREAGGVVAASAEALDEVVQRIVAARAKAGEQAADEEKSHGHGRHGGEGGGGSGGGGGGGSRKKRAD